MVGAQGGVGRIMAERRGRPTLEQVAARAGVGRGTVSRVVNGSPRVSAAARARVRSAIEALGYVPNPAARALVTSRTESVALVVSETGERFFGEPFFAELVRGVSAALDDADRQLLLAIAQPGAGIDRLDRHLTPQHVDGALLVSLHGADPLPGRLESRGLPTVLGGRPTGVRPVCWVDVDNRGGARRAVAHLAARGRRRIAVISGPQDITAGVDRLAGYRDALRDAGLAPSAGLEEVGTFSRDSGADAMAALLARRPDLDAVFVASDLMALGAMAHLDAAGRTVPGDVAVVGFDDSVLARNAGPPLTTVRQPVEEMGRIMVRLLLARIAAPAEVPDPVTLDTELVVRDSA